MDEIEDADDDNDNDELAFIGNNKENFNFNTFRKPLNFISAIYNGEISLKEAEFKQRDLEKNIGELRFNYKPKDEEEKEKINRVLMQANDLLEYTNKIIKHLKMVLFCLNILKN